MRYAGISHLTEGMILAKPLYWAVSQVMLGKGVALNAAHIRRISDMGYAGVYISDDISEGIEPSEIIPPALRIETVKAAKEIILQAESGVSSGGSAKKTTKIRQDQIIMPIIDAVIANPKRMLDTLDLKPFDDYVYYHAAGVVILSILLGVEMGLSGTQLYELGLSSLLHDLGNIFIPKELLNKPGKLTPEEYEVIKRHSQMGFDFLRSNFDISIEGCMGALQHHENFNGTGYPSRLKKDKISIYGRIIAITDVFDALTSRRPYRMPMYPSNAMEFIKMNSGTMFDPDIVNSLKNVVALYPSGACVELNSGVRCIVVENHPGFGDRPKLHMLNNMSKTPMYIDLRNDSAFSDTAISHIVDL